MDWTFCADRLKILRSLNLFGLSKDHFSQPVSIESTEYDTGKLFNIAVIKK